MASDFKLNPVKLFSLEEAIERMENMLGKVPKEWVSLFMFMPQGTKEKIVRRSAVASTFGGALEMAKRGLIEIQQDKNYAPIYIRRPGEGGAKPKDAPAETPVDRDEVAAQEAELEEMVAEELRDENAEVGAAAEANESEIVETETLEVAEMETAAADAGEMIEEDAVMELSEDITAHLTDDLAQLDIAAEETTEQEDLSDEEIVRTQQEEA